MHILRFLVPILFVTSGFLHAQGLPKGPNCDLVRPPAMAGEVPNSAQDFGTFARVYPRLTNIHDAYTGCQAIWSESSGQGGQPYFILIERGEVAGVWPVSTQRLCSKGEDQRTGCRDRLSLLMPSYPAGCLIEGRSRGRLSSSCVESYMSESQTLSARRFIPLIKNAL